MWSDMSAEQKKERIRQRIRARVDEEKYFYYPETVRTDTYKSDEYQRVALPQAAHFNAVQHMSNDSHPLYRLWRSSMMS